LGPTQFIVLPPPHGTLARHAPSASIREDPRFPSQLRAGAQDTPCIPRSSATPFTAVTKLTRRSAARVAAAGRRL